MTHESPLAGASGRSGGPGAILPVQTAFAPLPWNEDCECREATLLRMIASGELPLPMTGSFKTLAGVVRAAAIRKLRQVSHDVSEGGRDGKGASWASGTSHATLTERRDHYDRPPRTAAQLMAEARHSWAKVERQIASRQREAS